MKKWARIQSGVVVETFTPPEPFTIHDMLTPDFAAECIPCADDVEQGWLYQDGAFVAPEPEIPAVIPLRQLTFLAFMELFTEEEQLILVEASMTFPPIKLWYDKALGAQYIDLDDPRTGPGLQALVDANLITSERMAAVLAGQGP